MRVALVSAEFPPEKGGIQTYAAEFAAALTRRGCEVTVFTKPAVETLPQSPYRVERTLRLRRRLDRSILTETKFDVWHAMNAAYSWLALETRPAFVTVHGNDFIAPYQQVARPDLRERLGLPWGSRMDNWLGVHLTRRLVRTALPQATHIFANSRYTESRLCAEFPACVGKTSAAMVGVAESHFAPLRGERAPGPLRFITVCRLVERHKSVDLVLRALAAVKDGANFHYTIVGDGELRGELEALVDQLALREHVSFTGVLSADALREALRNADLFILTTAATPEAYEGFGLVYLEANAAGCPVLAARIGGAAEAVQAEVTGWFVSEVTVPEIAANLRRFLSGELRFDPSACLAFARGFTWDTVAAHCCEYYERALQGPQTGSRS